jgi:hypothetical protein
VRMLRKAIVFVAVAACSDPAPRMHVTRKEVPLGSPVVVHLEDAMSAPRSGALWLTLAPAGAPDSFVGERIVVDESGTHAKLEAATPGRYEVRLHDEWPKRPHQSATFVSK